MYYLPVTYIIINLKLSIIIIREATHFCGFKCDWEGVSWIVDLKLFRSQRMLLNVS